MLEYKEWLCMCVDVELFLGEERLGEIFVIMLKRMDKICKIFSVMLLFEYYLNFMNKFVFEFLLDRVL